jgi:hypothetical protein
MRKINAIFALLLAMVFLVSACAESTAGTTGKAGASTGSSETQRTAQSTKRTRKTTAPVKFPTDRINDDTNFHGETFTFAILTESGISGYGICESEEGTESVNKAIKERDEYIYDTFNAKIETVKTSAKAIMSELDAGNCTADFVYAPQGAVSTEYCRNISTIDINFHNTSRWGITWPMTVDGKGYAISGGFSLEMYNSAECILFNKDVKNQIPALKDVNFYEMAHVWDVEWTLDKLLEFSRAAKEAGKIGFASELNGIFALYFGSGQTFLSKTENRVAISIFAHGFSETAKNVTDKIISIFNDSSVKTGSKTEVHDAFAGGEALFAKANVGDIGKYFNEKVRFGILPLPFSESGKGGITCVGSETPFLFVLDCGASPEYTECFLWYYAYYSFCMPYNELQKYNAYFCTTDTESAISMSGIYNSLTYDFAYWVEWFDVNEKYTAAVLAGENPIEEFSTGLGEELEAYMRDIYGQSWKPEYSEKRT